MLGLPAPIKGLRIVPHRPLVLLTTTMCPKRRPPRPKHPQFTHFHRSGLRFGRFPAQRRSIGGVGGRRRVPECLAVVPVGGRAWPGFETTRRATHQRPGPAGVEGAGRTGGPGCGARGRWRGLAGLRGAAPNEVRPPSLAGGPPPTGAPSSPAPQQDPTAPGTPVGSEATTTLRPRRAARAGTGRGSG